MEFQSLKEIVDSFKKSNELEEFAEFWGFSEDVYIKQKILDLKWQELAIELDLPMTFNHNNQLDTSPTKSYPSPTKKRCVNQYGEGISSPQPGPSSEKPYIFKKKGTKVFKKTLARDTTYDVKFNDQWKGNKLVNLHDQLHNMFDDILNQARGDGADLGRVVIHHAKLDNPIVVPLQPWDNMDAATVMDRITNVLNSNEDLPVDDSMTVTVGCIEIPKGAGANLPITNLFGVNNSLQRKRYIFEIVNDNNLCLPIAIGICFLKTCKKVKADEWNVLTEKERTLSTFEKVLKYKTVPIHYYNHITAKSRKKSQAEIALILCRKAEVPTNRMLGLHDIEMFEDLLDVNIMVLSSKLGNRFIRVVDSPDRKNLYLYLVESENVQHFHGIASIAGFFGSSYFCKRCLKPYNNQGYHTCETTCEVCLSEECMESNYMLSCRSCSRTCRSLQCFERHKMVQKMDKRIHGKTVETSKPSRCETTYMCKTCKKVLQYSDRQPKDHVCGEWLCKNCNKYHIGEHLCYQRVITPEKSEKKKFLFYDFETRQDQKLECEEGYKPSQIRCKKCVGKQSKCSKCKLCQNCRQSCCNVFQHTVNFVVLQSSCWQCEDSELNPDSKCNSCGSRCLMCNQTGEKGEFEREPCPNTCGYRERVFKGDDAADKFCSHIMSEACKDSILIAHNSRSFDVYPILEVLIDRHAVYPDKIIYSGSKIMYMHIAKKMNLTFLDSLNFLPMKLSKLPKTFGLEEVSKGYFPHYFNTEDHQSYVGPYPTPQYYGCDFMSNEDRTTFLKWHESKTGETFDFQEQMYKYCRADVDILRRSCLTFRKIMKEVTCIRKPDGTISSGIDPFQYITIASVCMGIFKELFLKEEHEIEIKNTQSNEVSWYPWKRENDMQYVWIGNEWIDRTMLEKQIDVQIGSTRFKKSPIAMVPSHGYNKRDNFSMSSIRWLEWLMEKERRNGNPIHIRHALNGGEFRIPGTNYRCDGYTEKMVNGTLKRTVYEFHGCLFHACPVCMPNDRSKTTHPSTNQSLEELYTITKKRESEIKKLGYRYVSIWEHEYLDQLKFDPVMDAYVNQLDIQDRLNVRDSFFGGRTNAIRLHHAVKEDETIEYYDFTSLYPWTNKYCRYPVGHPVIITDNFKDLSKYFGIAKVKVLPPRGLYHPVLPYTPNGKLKFPLCKTCADKENQESCKCTDENRAIIGTWCTPELEVAMSKGYVILKIYEVYHFEESMQYDVNTGKGGLFADYVNMFLKIKQEASGFPPECITEDQKREYINQYKEREGIKLDYDNIKKNPGLRCLAKLCVNSFWGKFGQRLNMKQSQFIHESEANKFFQLLSDPRKNIQDFHIITNDIIQLEWSDDPMFLPVDFKTNIFLATFTTSWARLRLYSLLDLLKEDVLYMDTDSILFVNKDKGIMQKLPIGNYLGELTNEVSTEDEYIVEFLSGGSKNYAYRTKKGTETCKVRGFTLNWKNSQLINFDSIKDLIIGEHKGSAINVVNPCKISRHARKRKLYNKMENKEYKMVYTKRVLLPNLQTIPYGYRLFLQSIRHFQCLLFFVSQF